MQSILPLRIAVVVLAMGFAVVASAAPPAAEITPYLGYRMGGSVETDEPTGSYDLADASGYGLIVNFLPRKNTRFELLYARQDTEAVFDGITVIDGTIDLELHSLELGGTYDFDGETVHAGWVVLVQGDRIAAAGPAAEIRIPQGAVERALPGATLDPQGGGVGLSGDGVIRAVIPGQQRHRVLPRHKGVWVCPMRTLPRQP